MTGKVFHWLAIVAALLSPFAVTATDAMRAATKPTSTSTSGLPLGVPKNLRASYVHLGSWIVPEEGAPGRGFHDVYTADTSVEAYRKASSFPDGTVLVKEIRTIRSGTMTTGQASWADDPAVWFVKVKDTAGRYKNSPQRGDGWLWSLYKASAPN